MSQAPLTIAILGAGGRGIGFGQHIASLPQYAKVVAVAEPRDAYRESFAREHNLAADRVFRNWQEFCAQPKCCDAVVIATMDQDHVEPAVACMSLGYDMLLEKPMADNFDDCQRIAETQRETGVITCVCHSLRYHKGFRKLKELVATGRIGKLVSVDQLEQVAFWHQAHSFVRGNWGNEGRSAFMLLAKSCHDIDYLAYLVDAPCERVSSYGSLSYFNAENAPEGAGERCVNCPLEPECTYSAIRWYVDSNRENWPANTCSHEHTREAHFKAITDGPYGQCVWKCDNDVVDHQVVAMEFAGGATATFTMTAFTQGGGRVIRVHGTEGEIAFRENELEIKTFADNNQERIVIGPETGGHGGGDRRVVLSWLRAMIQQDQSLVVTDVQESFATHRIVFAAESARRTHSTVAVQSFS